MVTSLSFLMLLTPVLTVLWQSPSPFAVTLHMPGINSSAIEVDRAIEGDDDVGVHLLLESIALKFNVKPEPYFCRVGSYNIVGRLRPDWRRKEKEEIRWSTRNEEWLVTRDPLPKNAQALVRPSTSPPGSSSSETVAPVEWARRSAKERDDAAIRDAAAKKKREQQVEALRQATMKDYEKSKKILTARSQKT